MQLRISNCDATLICETFSEPMDMLSSYFKNRFDAEWKANTRIWNNSINLLAGQNIFSSRIGKILASDLGNRIVEKVADENVFPGLDHYLQIERLGEEICVKLFGCEAAEMRPVTGTFANTLVYRTFLRHGDRIASASLRSGSHLSSSEVYFNELGYRHIELPFNLDLLRVSTEDSVRIIRASRPGLVVLGGSVLLFPPEVQEIADATHEGDGLVLFDASHVVGLIAGNQFPNPIAHGADIMVCTTCKTVGGPQHAIVMGKGTLIEKIRKKCSLLQSGYHLHETAAAVYSLIELMEGATDYARAIVLNSRSLAEELQKRGIPIWKTVGGVSTLTHMFLMDARSFGGGRSVENDLADINIFVNRNLIPGLLLGSPLTPPGVRFGVAEVTRLGMAINEMIEIAEMIHAKLKKTEKDVSLKSRVKELRRRFTSLRKINS